MPQQKQKPHNTMWGIKDLNTTPGVQIPAPGGLDPGSRGPDPSAGIWPPGAGVPDPGAGGPDPGSTVVKEKLQSKE